MKVDGVVITYNPKNISDLISNIKSYIYFLNKMFIVDNSDFSYKSSIQYITNLFDNLVYVDHNGNKGVARALNLAAELALHDQADWLLTMDQDSRFENDTFYVMLEYAYNCKNIDHIGILSPFHLINHVTCEKPKSTVKCVLTVMTSGNLINLNAYRDVGPFNDAYFIDYIDHEYCLRLNLKGYKVILLTNSILLHNLGNISSHNLFGLKKVYCLNYKPLRLYYKTRNRLHVIKNYFRHYPLFCLNDFRLFLQDVLLIALFEENKLHKFKMIIKGIYDFIFNKRIKYYCV